MVPGSVRVDDEAREGAVFVGVAAVHLSAVQFDEDLIAHIQVQNDAVAGIVVVLVRVLSNGAGPNLARKEKNHLLKLCAELESPRVRPSGCRLGSKATGGQPAVDIRMDEGKTSLGWFLRLCHSLAV